MCMYIYIHIKNGFYLYSILCSMCVYNFFFHYLTINHNSAAIFSQSFSFCSAICDIIIISPNP